MYDYIYTRICICTSIHTHTRKPTSGLNGAKKSACPPGADPSQSDFGGFAATPSTGADQHGRDSCIWICNIVARVITEKFLWRKQTTIASFPF